MGKGLFMTDYEAFMGLEYAEKGMGMSEAKWVWAEVAYLWVSGAHYKLKFDRITGIIEVFKGFGMCFVG